MIGAEGILAVDEAVAVIVDLVSTSGHHEHLAVGFCAAVGVEAIKAAIAVVVDAVVADFGCCIVL